MLILPISVDYRARRPPAVNYFLIAVNMLVFILMHGPEGKDILARFALVTPPDAGFHVYQLVTYAFLHASTGHIAGNMLFLFVFGRPLCDRLGHVGYLAFYLGASVLAGLAQIASAEPGTLCVGASGAVCAVMGAHLVLHPLNEVRTFYWVFFIAGIFYVPSLVLVGIWAALDVVMMYASPGARVAYPAHVAGYLAGGAAMLLLLQTGLLRRKGVDLLSWLTGRLADGTPWRRGLLSINADVNPVLRQAPPSDVAHARKIQGLGIPGLADTEEFIQAGLLHAVAMGDVGQALHLYERCVVANPGAPLLLQVSVTVGNWYLRAGRYSEAVEAWRRATVQHPADPLIPNIHFSMGMVLSRHLNEPEAALSHLAIALPKLSNPDRARMARTEVRRLRRRLADMT